MGLRPVVVNPAGVCIEDVGGGVAMGAGAGTAVAVAAVAGGAAGAGTDVGTGTSELQAKVALSIIAIRITNSRIGAVFTDVILLFASIRDFVNLLSETSTFPISNFSFRLGLGSMPATEVVHCPLKECS